MFAKLLFIFSGVLGFQPPRDPIEEGQLLFHYDPLSHLLIAHNKVACFLATLNGLERNLVHTDAGMVHLEIQMMFEWIGKLPEVLVYHSDPSVPQAALRMCSDQLMYFLDRTGQHSEPTTIAHVTPPTTSFHVPTRTINTDTTTTFYISPTSGITDGITSTDSTPTVPSKGTDATPAFTSSGIAVSSSTSSSSHHTSTTEFTWPTSMEFFGPISATSSPHTHPSTTHAHSGSFGHMTTPSLSEPFVIYDGKDQITYAVIVSPSNECFFHHISDIDQQLLNTATKQDFETALLSTDRSPTHLWNITGQIGSMSPEVRTFCTGPVYVLM